MHSDRNQSTILARCGGRGKSVAVAVQIVADAMLFAKWWSSRAPARLDRAIVSVAVRAGLIVNGSGMIALTTDGIAHRRIGQERVKIGMGRELICDGWDGATA